MGAWGTGSFDNDEALDWIQDLQESEGDEALTVLFRAIVDAGPGEPLDTDLCSKAIAASEAVTALMGEAVDGIPDEMVTWAERAGIGDLGKLRRLALKSLERIVRDSDLKVLWEESPDFDEWKGSVRDLARRLKG